MNYCLKCEEVGALVEFWYSGNLPADSTIAIRLEDSKAWQTKLVCIVLFFARCLEHIHPDESSHRQLVRRLFSEPESLFFEVQEMDIDFVDYMLRHIRAAEESLDDALISLQEGLSDYDYAKALRT